MQKMIIFRGLNQSPPGSSNGGFIPAANLEQGNPQPGDKIIQIINFTTPTSPQVPGLHPVVLSPGGGGFTGLLERVGETDLSTDLFLAILESV